MFTGERETADAYIENVSNERKRLGDGATVVATNDGMVRLMAVAAGVAHASRGASPYLQRGGVGNRSRPPSETVDERRVRPPSLGNELFDSRIP